MDLPVFKYHPNPLITGSIIESNAVCQRCGQSKGYIYTSSVYGVEELHNKICPWCIADGSAANKFDATFVDSYPLYQAGIAEEIILEVTTKTPGYDTWQQEVWLSHCNDACAFLGDALKTDVLRIANEHFQVFGGEGLDAETMKGIAQGYQPEGSPAFYKFECLHCHEILYATDFD
jgi:uncharacterized protein CbrC (UPF0167 family)